jgi:hypothetical protein
VRGDSLRDFYAKTLAVLGLGVLAGAGAIVDYWPVSEDVPDVPAVVGLRSEAPVLVQNLDRQIPLPSPVRKALPAAMTVAATHFTGLPDSAAATSVVLDPLPAPEDFLHVERDLAPLLAMVSLEIAPAPVASPATDESRRPFGDAARRTRESLAAARLFLSDAFSGLAVAFRRVSPFFATGAVSPTPY